MVSKPYPQNPPRGRRPSPTARPRNGTTYHVAAEIAGQEDGGARQIRGDPGAAERDAALHVGALVVVGQIRLVEPRAHGAGQQRVAADAVRAQRARAALHQAQHPGLGRRVVRLPRAAHQRRDGRHPNDAPAVALRHHLPRRRLHREEGPVQVDAHREVEEVFLESGGRWG
jgi:hypothetical protein